MGASGSYFTIFGSVHYETKLGSQRISGKVPKHATTLDKISYGTSPFSCQSSYAYVMLLLPKSMLNAMFYSLLLS